MEIEARHETIHIPDAEIRFTFVRSGGPGGQNVNKVNTKSILHWNVRDTEAIPAELRDRLLRRCARRMSKEGFLVISSQRFRDQLKNRDDCLNKLRQLVVKALEAPKRRIATKVPPSSRRKRREEKQRRAVTKSLRRPPHGDTD